MDIGLIKDGLVHNVVCAESLEVAALYYPEYLCVVRTGDLRFGPGWQYDGTTFTPPALPEVET